MATNFIWTNQSILQLITKYHSLNILWDNHHPAHKDKIKKNDAWEELASEFNLTRYQVETKIHTLRSQYSREKRRLQNNLLKCSSWFAYDALTFLSKNDDTTIDNNLDRDNNVTSPGSHLSVDTGSNFEDSNPLPLEVDCDKIITNTARKRKYRASRSDECYQGQSNNKKRLISDDLHIYAQYVATELRAITDERSMIMAKFHINNILLEARLGKYRPPDDGQCSEFKIEYVESTEKLGKN